MSNWGKAIRNKIGWGQGANNNIGWGSIYKKTPTGETEITKKTKKMIKASEMIQRLKEQAKETQPMKVNTPKAIKYLTKLKRGQTPLVKKLHNVLLAVRHQVITMQDFENLIADYPEVEKLTNKGKESKLNGTLLTVQFYDNGSLVFTVILSEGKLYRFKK